MITFLDGPAKGQHLLLKRAPRFLRVTMTIPSAGPSELQVAKWDALDQPEDEPRPGETIYAYEIDGEPYSCHIRASGGRSGFYMGGRYKAVDPQPTDAEMRTNQKWWDWCEEIARDEKRT